MIRQTALSLASQVYHWQASLRQGRYLAAVKAHYRKRDTVQAKSRLPKSSAHRCQFNDASKLHQFYEKVIAAIAN